MGRTCADALGAAYDEDVFPLETLDVVFSFAPLDVPILGEDTARYHFRFTTWWGTIFRKLKCRSSSASLSQASASPDLSNWSRVYSQMD